MSVFASIWKKLNDPWGIAEKKKAVAAPAPAPAAAPAAPAAQAPHPAPAAPVAQPAAAAPAAPVDVHQILSDMAAKAPGGGGNWKVSIVDLLSLLGLDSSLAARKELAEELNVHAGAHGSAEQNIALYKAVMRQLQANGGKVPASLLD
ncbi:DUF3597 family protein [Sphingomonas solaris]|uniref:DUF3597 domain-containing protein n=1 Tax=Alterirhizorhabdus solaris TaxID=2529389 RepID=A0A558QUB0_9SPHN|nr:DUF3597 family protein [Sphingomonas solaris]TVV70698.1 DUF3597 domain-containing protein [Sphingomonas solaris]